MSLPGWLAELLACPACKGPLDAGPGRLSCPACRRDYPVEDGIPDLTPRA